MSQRYADDGWVRIVVLALGAIAVLLFLPMLFVAPMMGMMGWGMSGGVGGAGFSPLWGLGMGLLWLFVVLGVGYLLYRGANASGPVGGSDPALTELRVAYARGELSDEEFEQRRHRLQEDQAGKAGHY
jgi:putative membrane protein